MLLHSKMYMIGLKPKKLGADFLDYLYLLYGNTKNLEWASKDTVLTLLNTFQRHQLDDRLAALAVRPALSESEIEGLIHKLPEGANSFDWLVRSFYPTIWTALTSSRALTWPRFLQFRMN